MILHSNHIVGRKDGRCLPHHFDQRLECKSENKQYLMRVFDDFSKNTGLQEESVEDILCMGHGWDIYSK
jgi:hypothetical protein